MILLLVSCGTARRDVVREESGRRVLLQVDSLDFSRLVRRQTALELEIVRLDFAVEDSASVKPVRTVTRLRMRERADVRDSSGVKQVVARVENADRTVRLKETTRKAPKQGWRFLLWLLVPPAVFFLLKKMNS